jgi:hypothetical protein
MCTVNHLDLLTDIIYITRKHLHPIIKYMYKNVTPSLS